MQFPWDNEDFNSFKARKYEELQDEKQLLDKAIAFFDWLNNEPDGGRSFYNVAEASSMLLLKDDLRRATRPVIVDHLFKRREFAVEITRFLYHVWSVEYDDDETWSFKIYELPDKYNDWDELDY